MEMIVVWEELGLLDSVGWKTALLDLWVGDPPIHPTKIMLYFLSPSTARKVCQAGTDNKPAAPFLLLLSWSSSSPEWWPLHLRETGGSGCRNYCEGPMSHMSIFHTFGLFWSECNWYYGMEVMDIWKLKDWWPTLLSVVAYWLVPHPQ